MRAKPAIEDDASIGGVGSVRPLRLVPRALDDQDPRSVAAPGPPNDLDRKASVPNTPRVHRGLTGAMSAENLTGLGVRDLVDRLLAAHASTLGVLRQSQLVVLAGEQVDDVGLVS